MPLSFDDLVPQQRTTQSPPPSGGLSFDDLIPQKETAQPSASMSGAAPVPTIAETFFKNLGPYIAGAPGRFYDLAKGAVSGDILPQSANMPGGESQGDIPAILGAAAMGTPLSVAGGPKVLAPFKAPTEAALEASKTARYNDPAITNLQLKPEAGQDLANIIRTDLKGAKLDKFNGKPYYDIADRLENPRFGDNLGIDDLDAARQDAQTTASAPGNDRRGSGIVRNAIDNYLGNIPQSHVLSGDAAAANDALLKARADTAALKRSQDVSSALGRAENQAGSTYSGKGFENASRQQLRPILNEKQGVSKRPGFEDYTPEELEAARQAVNGTWLGNFVRSQEKRLAGGHGAGGSVLGMIAALGGSHAGLGPLESGALGIGTMGLGRGLGTLANRMAAGRGDYLGNLLRSRSPLANEMSMNPQMVPALWPQLLRIPPAGLGSPSMPILGINSNQF